MEAWRDLWILAIHQIVLLTLVAVTAWLSVGRSRWIPLVAIPVAFILGLELSFACERAFTGQYPVRTAGIIRATRVNGLMS